MKNRVLFYIVKRLPLNIFRVFFYRYIFKYSIGENVKIGKTIIKANKVEIGNNVEINSNNHIACNILTIGNDVKIFSGNTINGAANFTIGKESRIINDHFIDLWNNVTIGESSWLAGKGSQIWTHGSVSTKKGKDLSVKIGDNVYIGSNSNISPGVKIADCNLIGLGSVISQDFMESKTIIIGNPSMIVKSNVDWRENW